MGVVPFVRLVFAMGGRNGDPPLLFFRGCIDLFVVHCCRLPIQRKHLGDRGGQGRLTVVHMSNRAHVHMRFGPLELLSCHLGSPVLLRFTRLSGAVVQPFLV